MEIPQWQRFVLARTKYNQHGKQSITEVSRDTGVSKSLISNIENSLKEREVGSSRVIELAKHYGVSVDYLLGLTDCIRYNADLRAICDYTGLSEITVECLCRYSEDTKRLLDVIFSSESDIAIMEQITECANADRVYEKSINNVISGNTDISEFTKQKISHFDINAFYAQQNFFVLMDFLRGEYEDKIEQINREKEEQFFQKTGFSIFEIEYFTDKE